MPGKSNAIAIYFGSTAEKQGNEIRSAGSCSCSCSVPVLALYFSPAEKLDKQHLHGKKFPLLWRDVGEANANCAEGIRKRLDILSMGAKGYLIRLDMTSAIRL